MDRNFDDNFERFQRRIKSSTKGRMREILIREDLQGVVQDFSIRSLKVLDTGCGLGDMSVWLAEAGHEVTATDISAKMVAHTQSLAEQHALGTKLRARQCSAQEALSAGQSYDLICIHAVMEWLAKPYELLQLIPKSLAPGGYVSLTVYNLHRSVFNSLIKGNFENVLAGNFSGTSNPMSPTHPIDPNRVTEELKNLGLSVELEAGLRCFYDSMLAKPKQEHSMESILVLERRYRKLSPYRDIARYVHLIARKPLG